ncbi:hypothetical protein Tco_0456782, partial [Tanacetum coccineum]
MGRSGIK